MSERIEACAVRNPATGAVYAAPESDPSHSGAWYEAAAAELPDYAEYDDPIEAMVDRWALAFGIKYELLFTISEGYVTSTRRFVDRKEALHLACQARQIRDPGAVVLGCLLAEAIWCDARQAVERREHEP